MRRIADLGHVRVLTPDMARQDRFSDRKSASVRARSSGSRSVTKWSESSSTWRAFGAPRATSGPISRKPAGSCETVTTSVGTASSPSRSFVGAPAGVHAELVAMINQYVHEDQLDRRELHRALHSE